MVWSIHDIDYRMSNHLAVMTTSSIFRIILTTSVARVSALWVTRAGCRTFSCFMFMMFPLRTLTPAQVSPFECLFRNSVTTVMGLIPAF